MMYPRTCTRIGYDTVSNFKWLFISLPIKFQISNLKSLNTHSSTISNLQVSQQKLKLIFIPHSHTHIFYSYYYYWQQSNFIQQKITNNIDKITKPSFLLTKVINPLWPQIFSSSFFNKSNKVKKKMLSLSSQSERVFQPEVQEILLYYAIGINI